MISERLAELPKDSRLLLREARRVADAKDELIRVQIGYGPKGLTEEDAEFRLFIRRETMVTLRNLVEARDSTFTDFLDGEIRLMNDSLPVRLWR